MYMCVCVCVCVSALLLVQIKNNNTYSANLYGLRVDPASNRNENQEYL